MNTAYSLVPNADNTVGDDATPVYHPQPNRQSNRILVIAILQFVTLAAVVVTLFTVWSQSNSSLPAAQHLVPTDPDAVALKPMVPEIDHSAPVSESHPVSSGLTDCTGPQLPDSIAAVVKEDNFSNNLQTLLSMVDSSSLAGAIEVIKKKLSQPPPPPSPAPAPVVVAAGPSSSIASSSATSSSFSSAPTYAATQPVECKRFPDSSEVCKYKGLCFDPPKGIFVVQDIPDAHSFSYNGFGIDWRFYEPVHDLRPIEDHRSPFDMRVLYESLPSAEFQQLLHSDDTLYLPHGHFVVPQPAVGSGGNNMFHFTTSVAMLLDPQYHNQTYGGWYPPMDDVFLVGGDGELNGWTSGFMRVLLPQSTNMHLIGTKHKRICVQDGIVYGYRRALFLGVEDAHRFRKDAFQKLGIVESPVPQKDELSFPLRVLLMNRRPGDRAIKDIDGIKSLLESDEIVRYNDGKLLPVYQRYKDAQGTVPSLFTVTLEQAIEKYDFKGQIQLWASAEVIIAPHGAGLAAVIFARTHTVLIEIPPHKYYPLLYRDMAIASGHSYFAVMGEALPTEAFVHDPNDADWCELWHGVDELNEAHCHWKYFKFSEITLDRKFFIKTVQLALETLPFDKNPQSHQHFDPIAPAWLKPYLPVKN